MAFQVEWIIKARDQFSETAKSVAIKMEVINERIKEINRSLKEGSGISRLLETVGSSLMKNVTLPIIGIGAASLNSARKFQTLESMFTGMLGSRKNADSYLEGLRKMTQSLGIDFFQAADGAQALYMSGVKLNDLNKSVKMIGALSAGTGTRFGDIASEIAKINSMGRFTSLDMKSFAMMGINVVPEIAKLTKMSEDQVRKKMEKGSSLTSQGLMIVLEQLAKSPQFVKQMSEANKTLSGSFNILHESLDDTSLSMGLQINKTFNLSRNMLKMAKMVDGLNKRIILSNPSMMKNIILWGGIAAAIGPAILALKMAIKVFNILFILPFRSLIVGIMGAGKAFKILGIMIRFAFANPIGIIFLAITALILFFTTTKKGRAIFRMMVNAIVSGFKEIVKFAKEVAKVWEKTLGRIEEKYQKLKMKFHFGKKEQDKAASLAKPIIMNTKSPTNTIASSNQLISPRPISQILKSPIPVSQIVSQNNINSQNTSQSKIRVDINVNKAPGLTVDTKAIQQASKNVSFNVGKNLFGSGTI